jgi:RNA polymerase sigma factor (sigma-70 family)
MESISLQCPVTIKVKVTEKFRAKMLDKMEKQLAEVDLKLSKIDIQKKKFLEEHAEDNIQQVGAIVQKMEVDKAKGLKLKAKIEQDIADMKHLGLGAEIIQGTMQHVFNVKVGDKMPAVMNTEIIVEDEKIIEMFFGRSEQGIRELDIKYGKVCHNLSYHIVGSRQDAEECVNDAYLGAWNAIPPARPNPLLSYLVKIVRNISLKIYWRKEAAKRSSHYTIALEEIEACIAAPNTVEAEIEAKELARIIEAFLDTLTTENRVIFMRRYWFSDSYKDIAEFMGLSEKNISVRLTRIREKMKQYLIEREVFV